MDSQCRPKSFITVQKGRVNGDFYVSSTNQIRVTIRFLYSMLRAYKSVQRSFEYLLNVFGYVQVSSALYFHF